MGSALRVAVAALLGSAVIALWTLHAGGGEPGLLVCGRWTRRAFALDLAVTYAVAWILFVLLRRDPRAGLADALVANGSLLAVVALLEIPAYLGWVDYARWIGLPDAIRFTRLKPWENPSNLRDPELIFRHRPGFHFAGDTPGDLVGELGIATDRRYPVDVRYDSHGFRNAEDLASAEVVLIGDSFVEAGLVPSGQVISDRLAAELGATVANLGHSAYGPLHQRVVLERYALPLQPRAVVWFFFEGNDLGDVTRYAWARDHPHLLGEELSLFRDRSFLVNAVHSLAILAARPPAEDRLEARRRAGRFGDETLYFIYAGAALDERARGELVEAQRAIREASELCALRGIRFVLAFVPIKFRVYRDFCTFPPDGACAAWRPNELPQQMARFADAAGIEYLDLGPALREAAARGELVYFPDDGHWNARGNAVAARAVAEWLRAPGAARPAPGD